MRWVGEIPPLSAGLLRSDRRGCRRRGRIRSRPVADRDPASHVDRGRSAAAGRRAGWALKWIWGFRYRWLAATGLLVALAAALAHQFLVALAVLALLLLARLVEWRELSPQARATVLDRSGGRRRILDGVRARYGELAKRRRNAAPALARRYLLPVVRFSGFPRGRRASVGESRAAVRVDVGDPADRLLYPAVVVLAIAALFRLGQVVHARQPAATVLGAVFVLSWFALLEDFRPNHLLQIDSREVNFRRNMSSGEASHYTGAATGAPSPIGSRRTPIPLRTW